MELALEKTDRFQIQRYTNTSLVIQNVEYTSSILLEPEQIVRLESIRKLGQLDNELVQRILPFTPEMIIIGTEEPMNALPPQWLVQLYNARIGCEVMNIGAACRTFNILMAENRNILGLFIF